MLHNYLKLAIRLLIRDPFLTFINVAGLINRVCNVFYTLAVFPE